MRWKVKGSQGTRRAVTFKKEHTKVGCTPENALFRYTQYGAHRRYATLTPKRVKELESDENQIAIVAPYSLPCATASLQGQRERVAVISRRSPVTNAGVPEQSANLGA